MKKIIITDLDGTLLNKDKKIAFNTKKAIESAIKSGKMFAIASGRAVDECLAVINALEFKSHKNVFIIANNGALIYDVEHSKVIYKKFLAPSIANGVFEYMKKFSLKSKEQLGGHIHCLDPKTSQLTKNMHVNLNLPQTFYWWHYETTYHLTGPSGENLYANNWPKKVDVNINSVKSISNITKFVFYFENAEDKQKAKVQLEKKFKGIDCFPSAADNLEVAPKGINKGYGVKSICKTLGIKTSEVLCFGDNFNDVPMFKVAEGVTFTLAPDGVKKYAKHILPFESSVFVEKGIKKFLK